MRKLLAHLLAGKYIESILLTNQQLSDTVADQGRTIKELKEKETCSFNDYNAMKMNVSKLENEYGRLSTEHQAMKHKLEALQIDYENLQTEYDKMQEARDNELRKRLELQKQNQRLGGKYTALQKRIRKQDKE